MVVQKATIVADLAGPGLLLPNLVAAALAANARIKFALSWLQMAEASAGTSTFVGTDLEPERAHAGLAEDSLYAPPIATTQQAGGIVVRHAGAVVTRLVDDLGEMQKAMEAGAEAGVLDMASVLHFRARADTIRRLVRIEGDLLPTGFVSALSQPPHSGYDTLHGLVMDMHKALNGIVTGLAEDNISGAAAYRLKEDDKALVAAFMRGLNRTAPLKFDHPGLASTAMRDRTRLMIQNDIGATDVHVFIAYVEGLRLSITYSDIHLQRLNFFLRRLKDFSWTVANRHSTGAEERIFYVAAGSFEAKDRAALEAALERLGANLVFLIDWNKARKSLRRLLPKAAATTILDWAADHEVGHRGYLQLGGDLIITELLEAVSKATGGFYTSLQSAVGDDGAIEFLREVLRIASDGLKAGRSPLAVRDLLRAELLARVASIADQILDIALDHAALTHDLGNLVCAALFDDEVAANKVVARAEAWEALADHQVGRIRDLCGGGRERGWAIIASTADDAADNFEEAAFRLQFLSGDVPGDVREGLLQLAEHAAGAAKDYVRLLSALRNVHRGAPREDMRNFLDLVEKLHDQEHATDRAERDVFIRLMRADVDAKLLKVVTTIADDLEEVGDALLRSGRLVSDQALGEWIAV